MPEQGFQRCAAGRVEKMTIRSKHNDLLNYFIHDPRDLSPAYVRSCEKFFSSSHWITSTRTSRCLFTNLIVSFIVPDYPIPACLSIVVCFFIFFIVSLHLVFGNIPYLINIYKGLYIVMVLFYLDLN